MLIAGSLALLLLGACSSSKKAARVLKSDMVEVALPLSGPQYRTDAEFYRAVQSGVSPEMAMAKKIAMQNARQEIAAAVQTDLSSVTENYAKSRQLPSEEQRSYEERMTELTYSIVKQTLTGATLADEKLFREQNGDYRHFVCMEVNKEELKNRVLDRMKRDERLNSDFEYEQFKKIYEQKLADYSAE